MSRAHLIANKNSGKGKGSTLADDAKAICEELGYELVNYPINRAEDFESQSRKAVDAAEKDGGVVIAAGGDGTIRGVAQAAANRNVRFAAVPCGTFNFFARAHNIPEDQLEAFRLALTGKARPVQLGQVNGHIFLINASFGLYAKAIRERELATGRFGRNRLVVIISTIVTLLSRHLLLRVELATPRDGKSLYTPMVFIGNNTLQLRGLALRVSDCMKLGMLAVVLLRPVTKIETLRIILRGIFKTLDDEKKLDSFCTDQMTIATRKAWMWLALDGEMVQTPTPLKIKALAGALNLVSP
jgi:diacylglycerol kinase family enzyme